RVAAGPEVSQWRGGDGRGRQVLVRTLSRRFKRADEGAGGGDRDAGRKARPLQAEGAVAGFLDLLRERRRRRLGGAKKVLREGRRRGFQESPARRRALQVRIIYPGCRAGDGGLRG